MDLGAILLPASTAERHPAVLVGTPQRNTEIIAIPLAHGASTVIRSTDVQKPVRPVARLPMIMQITAIPTVRGFRTAKLSIEDYDYWCVASINGRFSIPELHSLLDALSATTVDFPDLIPEESNQTRSFSMEFSRALLQHYLHASWRYEHLTEEYLIVIDVDISVPACCITNAVKSWKSGKSVDKARRNVPPHRLGRFHQKIAALFQFKS